MLLGVIVAYALPWAWLKVATATACVTASHLIGLEAVRLSPILFSISGKPLKIDTACTMIDVYLGALPLLWRPGTGWLKTLHDFALFFAALMALNVARLVAGFWALTLGASWLWAHEIAAGFVYFAIFQALCWWIARDL